MGVKDGEGVAVERLLSGYIVVGQQKQQWNQRQHWVSIHPVIYDILGTQTLCYCYSCPPLVQELKDTP